MYVCTYVCMYAHTLFRITPHITRICKNYIYIYILPKNFLQNTNGIIYKNDLPNESFMIFKNDKIEFRSSRKHLVRDGDAFKISFFLPPDILVQ